jgi:MFS family permease
MTRGTGVGFAVVLRVGEFRAVWTADIVSVFGDQVARVGLAWLVFSGTSSALLTALTYALTFVPAVLGGWLLSGVADRYPRRRVLITTDLVRAVLAGVTALPGMPLPSLWVAVGLLTLAGGPFKAAQLALLPQILSGEQYPVGLAARAAASQVAQVIGFAGGGLLVTTVDPRIALGFNAATFVASAVLVRTGVRARPTAAPAAAARPVSHSSDAGTGHRAPIGGLVVLVCLIGLYVVPEGVAAPYAHAVGGVTALGVGVLMAADPLGSAVGAWVTARRRRSPTVALVAALAVAAGVPLMACVWRPGLIVSVVLWAASGAMSTAYLIHAQTLVTDAVPDHRRGRVLGRLATCLYASQGVAILLGGAATGLVGPFRAVALAGGAAAILAATVGWVEHARRRRSAVSRGGPIPLPRGAQRSLLVTRATPSFRSAGTHVRRGARPAPRNPLRTT